VADRLHTGPDAADSPRGNVAPPSEWFNIAGGVAACHQPTGQTDQTRRKIYAEIETRRISNQQGVPAEQAERRVDVDVVVFWSMVY